VDDPGEVQLLIRTGGMDLFDRLPRRSGRIEYRRAGDGALWGEEHWSIRKGADGRRVLSVHCEMKLGDQAVVRDSLLSVDEAWHPCDAHIRIMRDGRLSGSGWFRFGETDASCESWTEAEGRISQSMAIRKPMRGFGIHALMGDGWMAAAFPFAIGAGHVHHWPDSLLHSLHHLGATGPFLHRSTSGLRYAGAESVTVPAGTFDCHRLQFVGMTNNHPPYDMWISRCGDFLYVKGMVQGYMDSVFALAELEGSPL
jgi:hypothetical protein